MNKMLYSYQGYEMCNHIKAFGQAIKAARKAKELIWEQARVSIQEKLKEMQKQVREAEKKRNVSIRKKNMEL